MGVEGKVGTVDRQVGMQEESKKFVARPGPRVLGGPKKPVMHEDQVRAKFGGLSDGGGSGIDGGSDTGDLA